MLNGSITVFMPPTVPDEFSLTYLKLLLAATLVQAFRLPFSSLTSAEPRILRKWWVHSFHIQRYIFHCKTYSQWFGCIFGRVSMTTICACTRDFKSASIVAILYLEMRWIVFHTYKLHRPQYSNSIQNDLALYQSQCCYNNNCGWTRVVVTSPPLGFIHSTQ